MDRVDESLLGGAESRWPQCLASHAVFQAHVQAMFGDAKRRQVYVYGVHDQDDLFAKVGTTGCTTTGRDLRLVDLRTGNDVELELYKGWPDANAPGFPRGQRQNPNRLYMNLEDVLKNCLTTEYGNVEHLADKSNTRVTGGRRCGPVSRETFRCTPTNVDSTIQRALDLMSAVEYQGDLLYIWVKPPWLSPSEAISEVVRRQWRGIERRFVLRPPVPIRNLSAGPCAAFLNACLGPRERGVLASLCLQARFQQDLWHFNRKLKICR
eukprot:gnl/TRDRNA2_/TRDRNA2_175380_c0_seq1.p1 gnl/TRDRNA2_/TRDRNA2_175380_c0~~gnl/TRDRNA2_/TRDRNA2_175380_c0_seq1.p1  ORF type:complete len:286 (-),score=17.75 gnl/TRDRNA2_/TRDRNA2_175380_c0_seq1:9-806(-)